MTGDGDGDERRDGHHGHDHVDWVAMASFLSAWDDLDEPRHRAMAEWLGVAAGEVAVDVGSGAGGMTAVLVEAVGEAGTVIALDGSADLLTVARRRAARPGHDLRAVHADLEHHALREVLPRQPIDLVHASAVVHHLDDEVAALRSMADVVRPGGRVAVVEGGLDIRFLPSDCGIGEPGLEARLAAAQESWFWSEVRPAAGTVRTGLGWGQLLQEAGLVDVVSRSFLLDLPPPLSAPARAIVASVLSGLTGRVADRLGDADRAAVDAGAAVPVAGVLAVVGDRSQRALGMCRRAGLDHPAVAAVVRERPVDVRVPGQDRASRLPARQPLDGLGLSRRDHGLGFRRTRA